MPERLAELSDVYTVVEAPDDGGSVWNDFHEALRAAGDDIKRLWTLTQYDYEPGLKVWDFYDREDGKPFMEPIFRVYAESIGEASEKAEALFLEKQPEADVGRLEYQSPVYLVLDPANPEDDSSWGYATDCYALAGNHLVNRYGWVVTEEPWTNEEEYYRW